MGMRDGTFTDDTHLAALAGEQTLAYVLKLKLADPRAGEAFRAASTSSDDVRGGQVRTWQEVADVNDKLTGAAQETLTVGRWLLAVLAVAGVAGIVAGRVIAQRRRVGLLKAVGAGPGMVAAVHLAEYLVIGVAAAGLGLAAGWFAGPRLFRPSVGLVGSGDGPHRCG